MERALLIGNGLNQLTNKNFSWDDLMNDLAGLPFTDHEIEIRKEKPFTLWFEELSCLSGKYNLKSKIADSLESNLSFNKFHAELMKLKFDHILTTNYDYCLEESIEKKWKRNNTAKENYYSLFRRRTYYDMHVWHIHGELKNTKSIMLGHDQYTGYSQKISNYLSSGVPTESKKRNGKPYRSKFSSKMNSGNDYVQSWVDVFLESELHIIGFGLDYNENHIWSLITKKNQYRKKYGIRIGKTIYHRCTNKTQTTKDEAMLSILKALGVEIHDHASKTYEESYKKCFKTINE